MKSLRFAIVATLVAFAVASLANTDGFKSKPTTKIVNLTFEQAIKSPALVQAMYLQLNESMLNNNQHTYTVDVLFNGYICRITGTYDQWTLFFRLKWKFSSDTKVTVISN